MQSPSRGDAAAAAREFGRVAARPPRKAQATLAALTSRHRVRGLALLGGGAAGGRIAALASAIGIKRRDVKTFVGHGQRDPTVPVTVARESGPALAALGLPDPTVRIYDDVGHEITGEMVRDVGAFFKALAG